MNKKVGIEVVITKKRAGKFHVRHPDGFRDVVSDVPPAMYRKLKVGDTITYIGYLNREEQHEAVKKMMRGEFPEIERPSQN